MAVCAAITSAIRKRSEVVKFEGVLLAPKPDHENNLTADFWRMQVAFYTSCTFDCSVLVSKNKEHSDSKGHELDPPTILCIHRVLHWLIDWLIDADNYKRLCTS